MNNEITSNATSCPKTYCTSTTSMVYSVYQTHERSLHDGRRASATRKRTRMETCQKSKERQRILLREEMAKRRYLPWSRFQGRRTKRGRNQGKVSQSTIKNKAGTTDRRGTINFFIVASYLPSVFQTQGKRPRDSLPVSSIHIPPAYIKVWYTPRYAIDRKSTSMYIVTPTSILLGRL